MNTPLSHAPDHHESLRDIPELAARYAHNRTLGIIAAMAVFVVVWAVIAGTSWLAGYAYRTGSPLFAVWVAVDVAACLVWVWVVVTGRLNRALAAHSRRLYAGEVVPAALSPEDLRGLRRAGVLFASAILLTVLCGFAWGLPDRLMQPISALYTVPFLVYVCYRQGRFAAPLLLLWPALYALHAALVLARVPLGFLEWPSLSILFPMTVYGTIAAVAAHIHGRLALMRLRRLAQTDQPQATGGLPQ